MLLVCAVLFFARCAIARGLWSSIHQPKLNLQAASPPLPIDINFQQIVGHYAASQTSSIVMPNTHTVNRMAIGEHRDLNALTISTFLSVESPNSHADTQRLLNIVTTRALKYPSKLASSMKPESNLAPGMFTLNCYFMHRADESFSSCYTANVDAFRDSSSYFAMPAEHFGLYEKKPCHPDCLTCSGPGNFKCICSSGSDFYQTLRSGLVGSWSIHPSTNIGFYLVKDISNLDSEESMPSKRHRKAVKNRPDQEKFVSHERLSTYSRRRILCESNQYEFGPSCLPCTDLDAECVTCVQSHCLTCAPTNGEGSTCIGCDIVNCNKCSQDQVCDTCDPGYYWTIPDNQCTQCKNPLLYNLTVDFKCVKNCNVTDCAQCNLNYSGCSLTGCQQDYFINDTSFECTRCNQPNQVVVEVVGLPSYDACRTCNDSNCDKCSPFDITRCFNCSNGYLVTDNATCVISCPPDYFAENGTCFSMSLCSNFNTNCQSCTSTTNCTACIPGSEMNLSNNSYCEPVFVCSNYCDTCFTNLTCERCKIGYFLAEPGSALCSPCAQNCDSCNDSYPDSCSMCSSGYSLGSNNTCVLNCPEHYYNDMTSGGCQQCLGECGNCTDNSTCTTCDEPNGYYMEENSSTCVICSDISGRYIDGSTCKNCAPDCFTCNQTNCTSCNSGMYPNGWLCASCPSNCSTCTSGTSCSACRSNFYLEDDHTCSSCTEDGYFKEFPNCSRCKAHCSKCDSGTTCNVCSAGSCLYGTDCIEMSSTDFKGKYAAEQAINSTTRTVCLECNSNCESCSGSSTTCTSCVNGKFLSSASICEECDSPCLTCSSTSNHCLSCDENVYSWSSSSFKCLRKCLNNQYLNETDNTCVSCPNGCVSCNAAKCLSCEVGYKFDSAGTSCMNCSMVGYYLNTIDNKCYRCNSKCETCVGTGSNCTSCRPDSDTYLLADINEGACVPCKSIGQFIVGVNCFKCSSSCRTCQDSKDKCKSCPSNFFLTPAFTCTTCEAEGVYKSGLNCLACDQNCRTCSTASVNCTSCHEGLGITPLNTCVACTQAGNSIVNGLCVKCDSSCLTCNGSTSTDCLRCPSGKTLANDGSCLLTDTRIDLRSSIFNADKTSGLFVFSEHVAGARSPIEDYLTAKLYLYCSAELVKKDLLPNGEMSPTSQCTKTDGWSLGSFNIENDKLKVELKVSSSIEGATLVVVASRSGYFRSANNPKAVYPEDYLIVENVTVIKSALDGMIDTVAGPSAVVSAAAQMAFMGISASQSVALIKLFQALGYYIYIDCMFPSNFAKFLDMTSESPFNLMPNFFEGIFDNGGTPDLSRFIQYEWRISFFSNMGEFFTTMIIFAVVKAVVFGAAKTIAKMRIVNEKFGLDFFVGMFEGIHMELILSVMMFFRDYNDMDMKSDAVKYLVIVFVSLFSLFMISMYLFMGYTVSRLTDSYFKQEYDDFEDMKNESFKFWVEDKNMHGNIFQRHFNLIQLFKDIVFAALLYALYYKPLVLIILLTLIQAVFMACVFAYPPYNIAWMNNSLKITQCLYMVINLLFGVLAAYGSTMNVKTAYNVVGNMLIGTVALIVGVSFGFSTYASVKTIREYLKKNKEVKSRAKLNKVSAVANMSTVSIEHPEAKVSLMDDSSLTSNSPGKGVGKKIAEPSESKLLVGKNIKKTIPKTVPKKIVALNRTILVQKPQKPSSVMQAGHQQASRHITLETANLETKPKPKLVSKTLAKRTTQGSVETI